VPGIESLRAALEALEVHIDDVRVRTSSVALDSYPGGSRPSSTVELLGGGRHGFGEHVGWSDAEHAAFAKSAATARRGVFRLGDWAAAVADFPAYDRAALEAAAIDLALRQNHATLTGIAAVDPLPVRYVVSLACGDDPVADVARAAAGGIELKIDAAEKTSWNADTWSEVASAARIAVVDFKLRGDAGDHELACSIVKDAWIEDPAPQAGWSRALLARLAADAAVTSARAISALAPAPRAVNVKAPRVGGVLEAIDCLAACTKLGIEAYIGGMFEVGIGRRQSLALATVACPGGPNDIAPLFEQGPRPSRLRLEPALEGFAGDPEA
jgi:hypothetical protein